MNIDIKQSVIYYKTYYNSPIGKLTLFSDGEYLVELRLPNSRYFLVKNDNTIVDRGDLNIFKNAKQWLDKYFNNEKPNINVLPLRFFGSDFRKKVMSMLCNIPYGTIVTYKDIAKKISPKMSAQAVGNAVGHNPLCIIVPCHRVIGANNNLVGFGGGLDVKKWLLNHEGIDIEYCKTYKKKENA